MHLTGLPDAGKVQAARLMTGLRGQYEVGVPLVSVPLKWTTRIPVGFRPSLVVRRLAIRQHQMVHLVVHALRHHPDEAQGAKLCDP